MPPFTYEALPPADIEFVPLKQTRSFRADELMQVCAAMMLSLTDGVHSCQDQQLTARQSPLVS